MRSNFVWFNRIKTITVGGAARLLSSLSGFIISLIIIRTQSVELWGELVPYIIILDLGLLIVSWGSTPYLLREFSLHPSEMKRLWGDSLSARMLLLGLYLIVFICMPITASIKLWLMILSIFRFIYQAFDPIVQTERNFHAMIVIELISLGIVSIPLVFFDKVSLTTLLMAMSFAMMFKALVSIIVYRKYISLPPLKAQFFKQALPIFLIVLSTMLQQRMDLYFVVYFLSDNETAKYQVLLTLLLFIQFITGLVLIPYIKSIYRIKKSSFIKLEKMFAALGLGLSAAGLAVIYILIEKFYMFHLSWKVYLLGYLYCSFYCLYAFRIHELNRTKQDLVIFKFSISACIIGLIGSLLLVPRFGIEGALTAGIISQVFLVLLYHRNNAIVLQFVSLGSKATTASRTSRQ